MREEDARPPTKGEASAQLGCAVFGVGFLAAVLLGVPELGVWGLLGGVAVGVLWRIFGPALPPLSSVALPTTSRQTPTVHKRGRPPIPRHVKDAVWKRDGGRYVECGSDYKIHFDHIIPYSWGGSDTVENLQILCQRCNLRKGNRHL